MEKKTMRIHRSLNVAFGLVVALALFAGCSGGPLKNVVSDATDPGHSNNLYFGPTVATSASSIIDPQNLSKMRKPGQPLPSWMKLHATGAERDAAADTAIGAIDYVAIGIAPPNDPGAGGADVFLYPKVNTKNDGPSICEQIDMYDVQTIGYFGNKLWVPQKDTLNQLGTWVYDENCEGGSLYFIPDTDGQPAGIAFNPLGKAFVLNSSGTGGPGTGANIDVIPPHKMAPSSDLLEPNAYIAVGVALDSNKNVYMSWVDNNRVGHVDEFVGGQNPPVTLPMAVGYVGGVEIDAAGNLLLVDQTTGTIDVYAPPYGSSPTATILLGSFSLECRLDSLQTHIYCADYTQGSVDVYRYSSANPGATRYQYSWTNGLTPSMLVQDVALGPRTSH
jgi:hypothetical protein